MVYANNFLFLVSYSHVLLLYCCKLVIAFDFWYSKKEVVLNF